MAVTIGSNLSALRVIREIDATSRAIGSVFERLSSGLRINRAADDSAGLAVSESLGVKSRIFGRAILNVQDGISALQIADSATGQVAGVLQRMAELAEQAASGSLSEAQREVLDQEYKELTKEVIRISKSTSFNGIGLLAGQEETTLRRKQVSSVGGTGVTNSYIAASADGKYITFQNSNTNDLLQLNTETAELRTIASNISSFNGVRSDASGGVVVFRTTSNLTGQNSSNLAQLFKWDRNSGALTQVTNNDAFSVLLDFNISADGSTLAITGNVDYVDGGTVFSGSGGVGGLTYNTYAADLITGKLKAVKEGGAAAYAVLSLSPNGDFMSFASLDNPLGTNADGNAEIFVANLKTSTTTLRQITSTNGVEIPTSFVNNEGDVFWTSSYNLVGSNSALAEQLYKYDYSTQVTSQLTSNVQVGDNISQEVMSADGLSLSFLGNTINYGGDHALNFYRVDLENGSTDRLTNVTYDLTLTTAMLSADGNTLVASSGSYSASNELFTFSIGRAGINSNIEAGSGGSGSIETLIGALNGSLKGLGAFTLTSQVAARGALENVNDNISRLNLLRSNIGAGMSRLDSATNLLSTQTDQYKAAQSRIKDVDVAVEAASLLRLEIKQQAATALLAQANQQPGIALKLLQL